MWVCLGSLPREGGALPEGSLQKQAGHRDGLCHPSAGPRPWGALAPFSASGVQGGPLMRRWVGSDPEGNRSGARSFITMHPRFMEPLQPGLSLC